MLRAAARGGRAPAHLAVKAGEGALNDSTVHQRHLAAETSRGRQGPQVRQGSRAAAAPEPARRRQPRASHPHPPANIRRDQFNGRVVPVGKALVRGRRGGGSGCGLGNWNTGFCLALRHFDTPTGDRGAVREMIKRPPGRDGYHLVGFWAGCGEAEIMYPIQV